MYQNVFSDIKKIKKKCMSVSVTLFQDITQWRAHYSKSLEGVKTCRLNATYLDTMRYKFFTIYCKRKSSLNYFYRLFSLSALSFFYGVSSLNNIYQFKILEKTTISDIRLSMIIYPCI